MRSLLWKRTDPQGGVVLIVQQGLGMLQLLKFDAKGKKSLLGNLEIGKGGFQHLEMVVAYDTVKIR